MNFTLTSPDDSEYHKIMMQKHLQQKRHHHPSPYSQTGSLTSPSQSLPPIYRKHSVPLKENTNIQNQKMKDLMRQDMKESMNELQRKKYQEWMHDREMRKIMAKENGVLDYMEKEI